MFILVIVVYFARSLYVMALHLVLQMTKPIPLPYVEIEEVTETPQGQDEWTPDDVF